MLIVHSASFASMGESVSFLRMLRRFVSFLAALEASADPSSARSMALVFTGWLTRQLLGVLVLTYLGGMYTMSAQD